MTIKVYCVSCGNKWFSIPTQSYCYSTYLILIFLAIWSKDTTHELPNTFILPVLVSTTLARWRRQNNSFWIQLWCVDALIRWKDASFYKAGSAALFDENKRNSWVSNIKISAILHLNVRITLLPTTKPTINNACTWKTPTQCHYIHLPLWCCLWG